MLRKNEKVKRITVAVTDEHGQERNIEIANESGLLLWGGDKVTVDVLNSFYWDKRDRVTVNRAELEKNLGEPLVSKISEFKGNPVEITEENIVRYWAAAVDRPVLIINEKGVPNCPK